jgi:hypothetical protein
MEQEVANPFFKRGRSRGIVQNIAAYLEVKRVAPVPPVFLVPNFVWKTQHGYMYNITNSMQRLDQILSFHAVCFFLSFLQPMIERVESEGG